MKQVWLLGFLALLLESCVWNVRIASLPDGSVSPDHPYFEDYSELRHAIVLTPAWNSSVPRETRGAAKEVRNELFRRGEPAMSTMSDEVAIDWSFIAELEGKGRREGRSGPVLIPRARAGAGDRGSIPHADLPRLDPGGGVAGLPSPDSRPDIPPCTPNSISSPPTSNRHARVSVLTD